MIMVLYEPEIPPNTGNIARLCAAFDIELHLIEPLGFSLENKMLKRAGLDYWPNVRMRVWPAWDDFSRSLRKGQRLVMATTKTSVLLPAFDFQDADVLILGPETRGLPAEILDLSPWHVRIPMRNMEEGGARSINLSTSAGIILYAAMTSSGLIANLS